MKELIKLHEISVRLLIEGNLKRVLPEYAENTIVDMHQTKVRRGNPYIEDVDNKLLARGRTDAVESDVTSRMHVGKGRLTRARL